MTCDQLVSTCVGRPNGEKRASTCVRIWARTKSVQIVAKWTQVETLCWLASPSGQGTIHYTFSHTVSLRNFGRLLLRAAFRLVLKLVLCSKTLEGCYSLSTGHAVLKLVLFSKTLQGCTPCLMAMQPSNLSLNLSLNLSYVVKLCKAAALCLLVMQPSNLSLNLSW